MTTTHHDHHDHHDPEHHEHAHVHPDGGVARDQAVQQATRLNRVTIGYNAVESVIALGAGIAAGSVSLIGFGLDSVIEVSASLILAWRLAAERRDGCTQDTDRIATRGIAICFAVLGAYVAIDASRRLLSGEAPDTSIIGIVLTAMSLAVMPWLARAKGRLGPALGSQAQVAEASQTKLCAYMSGVVLTGLLAHLWLGWWWADPVAALGIAALAGSEAVSTWRADSLADTCCA